MSTGESEFPVCLAGFILEIFIIGYGDLYASTIADLVNQLLNY